MRKTWSKHNNFRWLSLAFGYLMKTCVYRPGRLSILLSIALILLGTSCSDSPGIIRRPNLEKTLAEADSLAENDELEKALAAYHIISMQWESIEEDDTVNAYAVVNASLLEAQISFYNNCDYGQVLESLKRARKIADRFDFPDDGINFLTGLLYVTVGEQNNSDQYFDKGSEYFVRLLKKPNLEYRYIHQYAASNLILFSDRGNVRKISGDALRKYFNSTDSQSASGRRFNLLLDSIMRSIRNGEYDLVKLQIDRMKQSDSLPSKRVLPYVYFIYSGVSAAQQNYAEAIESMLTAEKLVDPENGIDMQLQIYEALVDLYSKKGNQLAAGRYAEKANRLRRQITSFSRISSLKQSEYSDEIKSIESDLSKEKTTRQSWQRWGTAAIVFAILFAIIIGMLLFFIRYIRQKNKMLYLRYLDILALKTPNNDIDSIPTFPTNKTVEKPEILGSSDGTEPDGPGGEVVDSYVEEIQKIEHILQSSEELFSSEFNIASLAVLTGVKLRTLSLIISEYYHTSFRNLINSRRVRAVCLRLETGSDYDNLTVDAIAESVGIKSRTTFTSAFKRDTGMTPAQYIRFAKERKQSKLK